VTLLYVGPNLVEKNIDDSADMHLNVAYDMTTCNYIYIYLYLFIYEVVLKQNNIFKCFDMDLDIIFSGFRNRQFQISFFFSFVQIMLLVIYKTLPGPTHYL
jgi:hypothetical protein